MTKTRDTVIRALLHEAERLRLGGDMGNTCDACPFELRSEGGNAAVFSKFVEEHDGDANTVSRLSEALDTMTERFADERAAGRALVAQVAVLEAARLKAGQRITSLVDERYRQDAMKSAEFREVARLQKTYDECAARVFELDKKLVHNAAEIEDLTCRVKVWRGLVGGLTDDLVEAIVVAERLRDD